MSDITFFAKTNFRNQAVSFGIRTDDRRRHMYVIGKTGMGKTNLLENLAVQDIQDGYGVCYIDPHGDTAEKLLKAVPANRINDVVYFNPADQDFPIAFNVMEKVDSEYRHLVASGLVGVFKKIWADSWGPRLEYILRNAILALLEYPGSTLLGVTRILVDKKYRAKVVEKISDPVVRSFWVDEFSGWNDRVLQEVISPIQNKVGQFLSTSLIRNIVGQPKSSFDVRKLMDEKKILIMNLSKGRIGEDAMGLLGAMMITKIQLAAMGRVDIEEEERQDFYLYVDELQNFATESFANILSEARKYRLCLILANQYITQLDEKVRDAVFGNAGTIISFRIGAADAEFLEKEFEPVFMQNDLVNLPKYHIYLKLMIDGIAGDAFSATTLPPISIAGTKENEIKIINASRERYAGAKADVEEKINRWSASSREVEDKIREKVLEAVKRPPVADKPPMIVVQPRRAAINDGAAPITQPRAATSSPSAATQRPSGQPASIHTPAAVPTATQAQVAAAPSATSAPAAEEVHAPERELFETNCDTCGTKIQVPFKPDGKRPTFCKECLREYQRMVAKANLNSNPGPIRAAAQSQPATATTAPRPLIKVQPPVRRDFSRPKPEKIIERKTVTAPERPMTFSQIQNIAPKKFKIEKKKPNLEELRDLLQNNRGDE